MIKDPIQRAKYCKKYYLEHREEIKKYQKKWYNENKDKIFKYRQNHKEEIRIIKQKYRAKNKKKRNKNLRKWYKKYPWMRPYYSAKSRCINIKCGDYKNYGGRGIKFLLIKDEIKKLWFRDKAYNLKKPSIDRKDNDGNYEFNNCRFIEFSANVAKRNKEIRRKSK